MSDKETFDASDMVWKNVGMYDEEITSQQVIRLKHFVIYEDVIPPQRFQRLNPFAWINYWRKKRSNMIAYGWLDDEEDT